MYSVLWWDLCCSLPPGGDQDVTFGMAVVTTAVSAEVSTAGNIRDNQSTRPHRIYKKFVHTF